MPIEYCNIGSDLIDQYSQIERHNFRETLSGWEASAGNVYKRDQSGYVEMVFENGVMMTAGSNSSPAAGEFYYDSNADILYIQTSGSDDPAGYTIESGYDWEERKKEARNDAQELLESYLGSRYAVPFQKIVAPDVSYNSRAYDFAIRQATALLTCAILIKQSNSEDPAGDELFRRVYNPEPYDVTEKPGIVQDIFEGRIVLKTQRVARELGGFNLFEGASNSATAYLEIPQPQRHSLSTEQKWKIVIDTAGAPGTATYKLSTDDGATYDHLLQKTRDGDNQRVTIGAGIYVRFVGTFTLNDEWTIHLLPYSDSVTVPGVSTIRLRRA